MNNLDLAYNQNTPTIEKLQEKIKELQEEIARLKK